MRIVDVDDLELRSVGHLQPNTNDAFAEEHAERAAPPAERRHVGALTIGTVVGPEDRIEPLDRSNRSRSSSGVLSGWAGRWHVKQVRPLVPRSWKKGLFRSIAPPVATVR